MTEQEEFIMLPALVEKQRKEIVQQQKEIKKKDETIPRHNIQIEGWIQALLHATSKDLDVHQISKCTKY